MTKVVVAMSGGVDSSVAAVLLKQQGYEVIGMMLRLWNEPGKQDDLNSKSNRCCSPDSMMQARRVAARLDIPFYVIDAQDIFYNTVVSAFLDGYANGQTPNPCLVCNRQIRWDFLLNHALAFGADFMSTGHYVRKEIGSDGRQILLKGIDPAKDQSYVLHVLTQEKLAKALFPVGAYTKPEIREIAEASRLSVAKRPDSQDLCFLDGEDYRDFLQRNQPQMLAVGNIVDRGGKVLGQHNGLPNYTIGQRKGLGLASPQPLYVLAKEAVTNSLIVGAKGELGARELLAENVNWTSGIVPRETFRAFVKTRYTASPAPAEVTPRDNVSQVTVKFDAPQRDLTPGQAAVFYDGAVVMGGGLIVYSR
jgi:tRNA-specific 2-thiouridylase